MSREQLVEKTAQISETIAVALVLILATITLPARGNSQTLDKKTKIKIEKKADCNPETLVAQRKLDAEKCREKFGIKEPDMTKVEAKLADQFGQCMAESVSNGCPK